MIFAGVALFVVATRRGGESWLTMLGVTLTLWAAVRVAGVALNLF